MDLFLATAQEGLNSMIRQLWGIAQSRQSKADFPLRIVDDPETIRAIFNDADTFQKNYDFLDSFSKGRFSDNGHSWSTRTHLTQPNYSKNHFLKHAEDAHAIYLAEFNQLSEASSLEDIGAAVIEAAIKVVSQVLGFDSGIPWDPAWAARVRNALVKRQWIGFAGTTPEQLNAVNNELRELRDECAKVWEQVPQIQVTFKRFKEQCPDIIDFDPVQELIQNIIASTETTGATIMWATTILACRQDLQNDLRLKNSSVDNFIQELLRLYPPVPFVSRRVDKNSSAGTETFRAGEAFLVSIFGLHYSTFWKDALSFNPERFNTEACLRDHYMPFLIGPRTCGGRKLAELELRIAIPILLEKFQFFIQNSSQVSAEYGLSFRPIASSFSIVLNKNFRD